MHIAMPVIHALPLVLLAVMVSSVALLMIPGDSAYANHVDGHPRDDSPPEIFFCYDDGPIQVDYVSTTDSSVSIDLIVRDDHGLSSIWYFDDNTEADVTNQRPFTTSQYAPGVYTLRANATDASPDANFHTVPSFYDLVLNLERAATITINTVVIKHDGGNVDCPDLVPPTISIESSGTTGTPSDSFVLTANAYDARSTPTVVWYDNGQEIGKGKQITRTFTVGTHEITAIATDVQVLQYTGLPPDYEVIPGITPYVPANSKESAPITIKIMNSPPPDTTPPSVMIGSNATSGTLETAFLFTATASDASGINSITWYNGDAMIGTGKTLVTTFGAGTHTITAVALDNATPPNPNTSNAIQISVTRPAPPPDNTEPSISIVSDAYSGTTDTSFVLTATASDASGIASITWRDGNTIISTGTTLTTTFDVVGKHVITAVAVDGSAASNSKTSDPITITVSSPPDMTPPTITIFSNSTAGTTADTFELTATASDPSGISGIIWYSGDTEIGTGTPLTRTFDVGTHMITAVAVDGSAASNRATSNLITITVSSPPDMTPPTITIFSNSTAGTTLDTFVLTATAYDASGIARITWYDGSTEIGTGTTITEQFAAGTRTITAVAVDGSAASNPATSNLLTLDVSLPDTTPPTITIFSNSTAGTTADTFELTAAATDASGIASITWYDGSTEIGTGTTINKQFDAGTRAITAVAVDNNANPARSDILEIYVTAAVLPPPPDTTPPTITISSNSTAGTTADTFELTATASDPSGISGIIWYHNNMAIGTGTTLTSTFDAGTYEITAVAVDGSAASNRATSNQLTLNVSPPPDTTPPTITISPNSTAGTTLDTFVLTATASDESGIASITWYDGSTEIGTGTTITKQFAAGTRTITAVAVDNNDNPARSNELEIPVTAAVLPPPPDTTPPTITITSDSTTGTTLDTFELTAAASDASGISGIIWYSGDTEIGTGATLTRMFDVGTYVIMAVAVDGSAASNPATSDPITITVSSLPDSMASNIEITTSAASGTTATVFQLTAVTFDGGDDLGELLDITWYDGNDLIGVGQSLSYTFDVGTHVITAVASDGTTPSDELRSDPIIIVIEGIPLIPMLPAHPPASEPPARICR